MTDISRAKLTDITRRVSSCFATKCVSVSDGICQTALEDESVMIGIQMGTHSRSENGRDAWDAFYDTTP
jgi:hypothetical protein